MIALTILFGSTCCRFLGRPQNLWVEGVGSKDSAELQLPHFAGVGTGQIVGSQPLDFVGRPGEDGSFSVPNMSCILQPWHILLAILCGLVQQRQQQVIEFQNAQISALLRWTFIGRKRLLLNDDQRRLLR
ncbi:MAG: hypothetical protein R3C01_02240 [Planctomycetaceae bacterium]